MFFSNNLTSYCGDIDEELEERQRNVLDHFWQTKNKMQMNKGKKIPEKQQKVTKVNSWIKTFSLLPMSLAWERQYL